MWGWSAAIQANGLAHPQVELEIGGAWREAALSWDIASDPTGTVTPNVLSALDWQDVTVLDVFAGLECRLPNQLFARVDGTLGNPVSGTMTDADYAADNRQQETRRSTGKVSGQRSLQGGFALGRYWALSSRWRMQTAVGGGFSTLELNNEQGYLQFDAAHPDQTGSFAGLDSVYNAYWSGILVRAGAFYEHPQWQFGVTYSLYPNAHYDATARWNLRSDLAQPKSFDQDALGKGEQWEWRIGHEILPSHWLMLMLRTEDWQASQGDDRLYRPGRVPSLTRLNHVQLESTAWALAWQRRW